MTYIVVYAHRNNIFHGFAIGVKPEPWMSVEFFFVLNQPRWPSEMLYYCHVNYFKMMQDFF